MPTNVDSLEKPGLHEEEPGLHEEEPGLHDEEPGASKAPPDGAHLERLANEHQVNTIEDGDTLAGNEFDGSRHAAEAVTKPRTFADACTHPSAKRITVHGRTGPVNAVEVDGTLFIQNDEAEAKAEATLSKAMGPASEAAATTAAASEVAAQP